MGAEAVARCTGGQWRMAVRPPASARKLAMPIFMKVVCLAKLHIFPLGGFEVFSEILENVPKF
jgi:hypothetical protein